MVLRVQVAALLLSFIIPVTASALTVLSFTQKTPVTKRISGKIKSDGSKKANEAKEMVCATKYYFDTDRLRLDNECPEFSTSIITHKGSQFYLVLDHKNKTYSKRIAQDILAQQSKVNSAQLEILKKQKDKIPKNDVKSLKELEDTQKKIKAEQQMSKNLKALNKTKKIQGWDCSTYSVVVGGKLQQELCLTKWADQKQLTPLMPLLNQMTELLKIPKDPSAELKKQGLIIEATAYADDRLLYAIQFTGISQEDKPSNFFSVPINYKRLSVLEQTSTKSRK